MNMNFLCYYLFYALFNDYYCYSIQLGSLLYRGNSTVVTATLILSVLWLYHLLLDKFVLESYKKMSFMRSWQLFKIYGLNCDEVLLLFYHFRLRPESKPIPLLDYGFFIEFCFVATVWLQCKFYQLLLWLTQQIIYEQHFLTLFLILLVFELTETNCPHPDHNPTIV